MPGGSPDIEDAEKVMCASKFPVYVKVEEGKQYYYCTCGRSKNQPWCDGSHSGTKFQPMAWTAPKTGSVRFCRCKSTKTPPLCDYSHVGLMSSCCSGVSVQTGGLYVPKH
ncbi:hypothetical protein GUITHDRAFT_165992 [Guillardia theta CCMP2712]|uniref:Iron-binding zinc finger CDGSH type domain-containing protein n=1 Tax=Guillardia theta (strain CCMP2712) TaxID=905079 RepID=L1IGY7_GUITC|nr:hypothetical protein GUITHDRAFT_165992 [Guillardia theta CCMP2712]EKX35327.1 hypothetical protein GUITHDRAFT_165992 [Guillardia theta CCMP2712]|eukprot:XP_005822307.1 hypothetical protein GUITHDRAFT_165992 [Guillardia theta CCMP2712]